MKTLAALLFAAALYAQAPLPGGSGGGGSGVGAANIVANIPGPATSSGSIDISSLALSSTTLNTLIVACYTGTGVSAGIVTGDLTGLACAITGRTNTAVTVTFSSSSNVVVVLNSNGGSGPGGSSGSNCVISPTSGSAIDGSGCSGFTLALTQNYTCGALTNWPKGLVSVKVTQAASGGPYTFGCPAFSAPQVTQVAGNYTEFTVASDGVTQVQGSDAVSNQGFRIGAVGSTITTCPSGAAGDTVRSTFDPVAFIPRWETSLGSTPCVTPGTLGTAIIGIVSKAATTHRFVTNVDANGIQQQAQPVIGDITAFTSAALAGQVTDETGSGALVFAVSPALTGNVDASGATTLKLPVAGGAAPAVDGQIAFDSTAKMLHASQNGADAKIPQFTITPTNGDCATWVVSGSNYKLGDAACGSGGGASTALDNLASVNINTALLAQTGVDLGSTLKPFRDLYLFGAGTYGTNYFKFTGTPTSTRTLTLPDRTATVATSTGTLTSGNCVTIDGSGNFIDAGGACTTGGGGGTVNAGTAGHLPYYATSTNAVSDMGADFTFNTHTLTGGASAIFDLSAASSLKIPGSLSTGLLRVTTSTGALGSGEISGDCTTSGSNAIVCTKSNGVALSALATATGATLAKAATYQVVAADFTNRRPITVASGTFNLTMVDTATQPADGSFIDVLNYGSGVVTIVRSGQNLNGGTASLVLPAASATAPSRARVWSNGTDYFITLSEVPASTTCTNQFVRAVNGTAAATCASVATADVAGNAIGASQMAVVNTRRTVCLTAGAKNAAAALADADLADSDGFFVPAASTVVEVTVHGDAGTPNVIVGRDRAGSVVNLTSAALATGSAGVIACSNTGGTTGLDATTTCSSTLQNTGLNAGDWLKMVSGTAGGTAKQMSACITFTIN